MIDVLKGIGFDFIFIFIPAFVFGNLTMLLFLMNTKFKWEDKHEHIRNKRIRYISYLENILVNRRREQSKIDVD